MSGAPSALLTTEGIFMAVAAESQTLNPPNTYRLVDSVPELYAARMEERGQAEDLLARRRNALELGGTAIEMPLPIDALSTAYKVLEAAETYGEGSAEHVTLSKGILLDCQRLVAEWYRKLKPEHFQPVRHIFDKETEEFFSHGLSIRQMTENALTPIRNDPEEEARRVNERVEDATPQILRRLGGIAIGSEAIRTISECTDKAINDYDFDRQNKRPHRGYGGYVPEIKKLMIRDIRLDDASGDRFEEQVGLPGTYITHEIIQLALARRGAMVTDMDKTQLHGAQLLARDDLMVFVELLDTTASEEWCVNIFMGEQVPRDYVKNYNAFRQEALQRQKDLRDLAKTVATYVVDLAEDGVDRLIAPAKVEEFVKIKLLELGKKDFGAAEQMFDTETALGLQEVARLEAAGRSQEAYALMQQVNEQAPGGGYCGAGSCGLEAVDLSSDEGKRLADKVGAKTGDTVLKDKDRACKCGSKKIVYAYSSSKVNKYCDGCGKSESKASAVAA